MLVRRPLAIDNVDGKRRGTPSTTTMFKNYGLDHGRTDAMVAGKSGMVNMGVSATLITIKSPKGIFDVTLQVGITFSFEMFKTGIEKFMLKGEQIPMGI